MSYSLAVTMWAQPKPYLVMDFESDTEKVIEELLGVYKRLNLRLANFGTPESPVEIIQFRDVLMRNTMFEGKSFEGFILCDELPGWRECIDQLVEYGGKPYYFSVSGMRARNNDPSSAIGLCMAIAAARYFNSNEIEDSSGQWALLGSDGTLHLPSDIDRLRVRGAIDFDDAVNRLYSKWR